MNKFSFTIIKNIKIKNGYFTVLPFLLYFWSKKCSIGEHKSLVKKKKLLKYIYFILSIVQTY